MRHAWVVIIILSACVHDQDKKVIKQSSCCAPLDAGWHLPHDVWVHEDSLRWHQDFFDQRALHHLIMP